MFENWKRVLHTQFYAFSRVVTFAIEEEINGWRIGIIHSFACALCTVLVLRTQVAFMCRDGGNFLRVVKFTNRTRKIKTPKIYGVCTVFY